jgi:putative glutamine amidotransferase
MTGPSPSARIAVLLGREPEERVSIHRGYVDAVFAAGAVPVLIAPGPASSDAALLDLVRECDAVMFTGGHDVDPVCYGETNGGLVMGIDIDRDRFEIAAVAAVRGSGQRVLGICRGAQLLNVALGGTLHQDLVTGGLDHHSIEELPGEPSHVISVVPGSTTEMLLDGHMKVNSLHHQGVKDLARGLTATATAGDGLVEAFEAPDLVAMQWHPERMLGFDDVFLRPFAWLAGDLS